MIHRFIFLKMFLMWLTHKQHTVTRQITSTICLSVCVCVWVHFRIHSQISCRHQLQKGKSYWEELEDLVFKPEKYQVFTTKTFHDCMSDKCQHFNNYNFPRLQKQFIVQQLYNSLTKSCNYRNNNSVITTWSGSYWSRLDDADDINVVRLVDGTSCLK